MMGIRRVALEFETEFTRVPNAWARDVRLSRRARGLLVELMSHRVGWHVSVASLMNAGTERRDAIRSAITELVEFEYLVRVQVRNGHGRFNEVEYELRSPLTADGKSDTGGFTDVGSTDVGESDTKKNIIQEDQELEPPLFCPKHPNGGIPCGPCKDAKRIHEKWLRSHRAVATVPRITRPKVCEHERPIGECEYCEAEIA